jgi:3',5'-cyclic-AMP phosphodiesterase
VTTGRPDRPELMSVGPDEIVITFTTPSTERVATRVGDHEVTTTGPRHVAQVAGLEPDTEYPVAVEGAPPAPFFPPTARTLVRPSGRLRATVATANDTHLGEREAGRTGDPATDAIGPILRSAPGDPPYPEVMNRAVVDEMRTLDPDAVVVKGDLTAVGSDDEYAAFLAVYGALGERMHHVRGNHDAFLDPTMAVEGAPYAIDLDGVTLAVLDTVIPGTDAGQLPADQVQWLDDLASERTGPVLVFGHHHCWNVEADRRPDGPYFGIRPADSEALVNVVSRHDHVVGYFAGHTHTNRVRRFASARRVPFAEVGCTKDYPGAWAEYRIYDGGYTQVMRRVTAPAAFDWAERCRSMIQGIYGELVLGPLEQRCFTERF